MDKLTDSVLADHACECSGGTPGRVISRVPFHQFKQQFLLHVLALGGRQPVPCGSLGYMNPGRNQSGLQVLRFGIKWRHDTSFFVLFNMQPFHRT